MRISDEIQFYLFRKTCRQSIQSSEGPDTSNDTFLSNGWEGQGFLSSLKFSICFKRLIVSIDIHDGSLLRGHTVTAAQGGDGVPAERHHGEGEHQPGRPEGQRVKAAEGEANFPFPS